MSVQQNVIGIKDASGATQQVATAGVTWNGANANLEMLALTDPASLNQAGIDSQGNVQVVARPAGKTGYSAVPTSGTGTTPVVIGALPAGTRAVQLLLKSSPTTPDTETYLIAPTSPTPTSPAAAQLVQISGDQANSNPVIWPEDVDPTAGLTMWITAVTGSPQWRAL